MRYQNCPLIKKFTNDSIYHKIYAFKCVFVIFPCGIAGQVWYLIVLIPDFAIFFTLYNSILIRGSMLRTIVVGFCALIEKWNFFTYKQNTPMSLGTCSYAQIIQRWIRNICVRTHNTSMSLCTCSYVQIIQRWKTKIILGVSANVYIIQQ